MTQRKFFALLMGQIVLGVSAMAQPPGITLNPGETYVPGSLRDQNGNPVHDRYPSHIHSNPPNVIQPDFSNPTISDSGYLPQGWRIDPFTGRLVVDVNRDRIKDSALDPNRGIVDPGSLRNIDQWETDANGVVWHITGTEWTSYGVPHSNLRRRTKTQSGGVELNIDDKIARSPGGPGVSIRPNYPQNSSPNRPNYPQNSSPNGPWPQGSRPSSPSGGRLNQFGN
jgi:hypothetical protein